MKKVIFVVGLLAISTGCTSIHTNMNYDNVDKAKVEHTGYSTYKFYPVKGEPYYGDVERGEVKK